MDKREREQKPDGQVGKMEKDCRYSKGFQVRRTLRFNDPLPVDASSRRGAVVDSVYTR